MDKKYLRRVKRTRQRQRIALRIRQLRGLTEQGRNVKDAIFFVRQVGTNYPKL